MLNIMTSLSLPGFRRKQRVERIDIIYLAGVGNYTCFHLANGHRLIVARTLAQFGNLPQFLRIHKSYLVNQAHIQQVRFSRPNDALVRMRSGDTLPVACRRVALVARHVKGLGTHPALSSSCATNNKNTPTPL